MFKLGLCSYARQFPVCPVAVLLALEQMICARQHVSPIVYRT
jgi:hypothetical protein